MSGDRATTLGLYGKLSARGDFVTRNFSRDFVLPWDQFLQQLLVTAQENAPAEWLNLYLTAPIWRFALASCVCGTAAVAGVLMPSVDNVGRYFPLTLGMEFDRFDPALFAALNEPWFAALEEQALAMLDPNYDLIDFDQSALPPPSVRPFTARQMAPVRFGVSTPAELQAAMMGSSGASAIWWTLGSDVVAPSMLASTVLPSPTQALALVNGDWVTQGWGGSAAASESETLDWDIPDAGLPSPTPGSDESSPLAWDR